LEISLPLGSSLWFFSDFLGLSPADEILLERLAARAELRLGLIEDTTEITLPKLGRVTLRVSAAALDVDTNAAPLRAAYASLHAAHRVRLQGLASRLRGQILLVQADDNLPHCASLLAGIPS
jgi:hypothetical protein